MTGAVWKLEWYRLVRTHRLLCAAAFFAVFGVAAPFMAYYSAEIVAAISPEAAVDVPPATPEQSVATYVDNTAGLGILVTVLIAAAAVSVDSRPQVAVFYRSRLPSGSALVLPRYVMTVVGMVVAYSLGIALVWYETAVLIGPLPAVGMLAGMGLMACYLAFAVAVTAAATALVRSFVGAVAAASLALLAMHGLAAVPTLGLWLPSALVNAQQTLLHGETPLDYAPALATAMGATVICLAITTWRLDAREV
jgi:ABC-2 type transport system permease protein